MIRIRLTGTADEINEAMKKLKSIFIIENRSRLYSGSTKIVRLYCDVDLIQKENKAQ